MPRICVFNGVTDKELLDGIAEHKGEEGYAKTFGVTGRYLRYELVRRGLKIARGRKTRLLAPVESMYRGQVARWYATKGRHMKGLTSYKKIATASGCAQTEVKRFFQARKRAFYKLIKEEAPVTKASYIFTSVDGKKFPGVAVQKVIRVTLDPYSVMLTLSVELAGERSTKIRIPLRIYLQSAFSIHVPHLVDQVKLESLPD